MTSLELKRHGPGFYETGDGQHAIVRTEEWEGPRGGNLRRWEILKRIGNDWCADDFDWHFTMKAARTALEAKIAA